MSKIYIISPEISMLRTEKFNILNKSLFNTCQIPRWHSIAYNIIAIIATHLEGYDIFPPIVTRLKVSIFYYSVLDKTFHPYKCY